MSTFFEEASGGVTKYTPKVVIASGRGDGSTGGFSWTADKDYDYAYCVFSCYKGAGAGCNATNGAIVTPTGNIHTNHGTGGAGNTTQSWFISNIKSGANINFGYNESWQSSQAILVMFDKA